MEGGGGGSTGQSQHLVGKDPRTAGKISTVRVILYNHFIFTAYFSPSLALRGIKFSTFPLKFPQRIRQARTLYNELERPILAQIDPYTNSRRTGCPTVERNDVFRRYYAFG